MNEQDRQRRRALVVFQVAIYGFLGVNIAVQLWMWKEHGW